MLDAGVCGSFDFAAIFSNGPGCFYRARDEGLGTGSQEVGAGDVDLRFVRIRVVEVPKNIAFTFSTIGGTVQAVLVVLLCTVAVPAFAFATIVGTAFTGFTGGFIAFSISTAAIIAVGGTLGACFAWFAGAVSAASTVSIVVGAIFWTAKTVFVVCGFTISVTTHAITAMVWALVTADQHTIDFLPTYFVSTFERIAWATVAGAVVAVFSHGLIAKCIAAVIAAVVKAVVTVFPIFDIANPISTEARWLFAYSAFIACVGATIPLTQAGGITETTGWRSPPAPSNATIWLWFAWSTIVWAGAAIFTVVLFAGTVAATSAAVESAAIAGLVIAALSISTFRWALSVGAVVRVVRVVRIFFVWLTTTDDQAVVFCEFDTIL